MVGERVLFVRVGWMKRYKGQTADDKRPIGGGGYNKSEIGGELFNFLPVNGKVFGYFQPQLQPPERRKAHPSFVNLERIDPNVSGDKVDNVLVVFVSTDPVNGGQRVVGWYTKATVYRYERRCTARARREHPHYFAETAEQDAFLIPDTQRSHIVPGGKGGFGTANVRYLFPIEPALRWLSEAVAYVNGYNRENLVQQPESETDPDLAQIIQTTMERTAGFQSNPRIRMAIERYAMTRAMNRLKELGMEPIDEHINHSYDIRCTAPTDLYVEVKGTQDSGASISLTPKEVEHVQMHTNSALFVLHSVKVSGKRNPKVSSGDEIFIRHWDISAGRLEPRSYLYTLPASAAISKKSVTGA